MNRYSYAELLALSDRLREPLFRAVIASLPFPPGSRGFDAGCGIGSHSFLLADLVGSGGNVTGCDQSSELLSIAETAVKSSPLGERVSFERADVETLPYGDAEFDWVWSVDCIGYFSGRNPAILQEVTRVLKPGGCVALLVWSSQQLLPGYPALEARLNATSAGIAPFTPLMTPESHHLRLLTQLREAGLQDAAARTFVGDIHSPVDEQTRRAVAALFSMRWKDAHPELAREDWTEFERLCDPGSPDFIAGDPGYYAFYTYTLFLVYKPQ